MTQTRHDNIPPECLTSRQQRRKDEKRIQNNNLEVNILPLIVGINGGYKRVI